MAKKCPECKPGVPLWVLSYGDTMSLLLCFFILLLSFANMDARKFNAAAGAIQATLKGIPNPEISHNQASFITKDFQHRIQLVETMEELRMIMKEAVEADQASVTDSEDGIMLTIEVDALFEAEGVIRPAMLDKLREIANIIHVMQNIIQVSGHVDRSDIVENEPYSNKWFLSAAYAAAVGNILDKTGLLDPMQLEVRGLADRYPVSMDDSLETRKKNRRVEIVMTKKLLGK